MNQKVDATYELMAAANERAVLNERIRQRDARIAELEAKLASIGADMPEMLALCEHKDNRVAQLEAKLAKVRDIAHTDLPIEYERRFLEIIDGDVCE